MTLLISICVFISIIFIVFFIIGVIEINIIDYNNKHIRKYNYTIGKQINGAISDSTYASDYKSCAKYLGSSKTPSIASYNNTNKQCLLYNLSNKYGTSILFNNKWIKNKIFSTKINGKDIIVNNINNCKTLHKLYNSDFTTYKNRGNICTLNNFPDYNYENYLIIPNNTLTVTPSNIKKIEYDKGYVTMPNSTIDSIVGNTDTESQNKSLTLYYKEHPPYIDNEHNCAEYLLDRQKYELLFKNFDNIPILATYDSKKCNLYKYPNTDTNTNTKTFKFNDKITNINILDDDVQCGDYTDITNIVDCMNISNSNNASFIVWDSIGENCKVCNFKYAKYNLIFNNNSTHI